MGLPNCLELLRGYVAIPSVNPMGREDMDPSIVGERRYAEHVREQLRALGLDAELVGDPVRPSLVAEASVPGARETLMVASHLDTVPVDGMQIDPFDPVVEGERLFGRGACDTKPGLACLVDALRRVLDAGTLRRNLVIVGEADEECESRGALDVVAHLSGRSPDWALVTEPTQLRVVNAHKGVVRSRLAARGVACHSSDPERGKNALTALARAIVALDAHADRLREREDEALGHATLSVGAAGGGNAPNIVPESAWLLLDRRLLPDESGESVRAEIEGLLASEGLSDVSIEWLEQTKAPLAISEDHAAVRACLAALDAAGVAPHTATAAFATDGGIFASHGIPSVVLGAGSIEQAHTAREWVSIPEVEAMAEVYRRLLEAPSS
jgi:acetylornithine deacetylase